MEAVKIEIKEEDIPKVVVEKVGYIKIPQCLTSRPIMFGDEEQRVAVREIEKKVDDTISENIIGDKGEGKKRFSVCVTLDVSDVFEVYADDLREAETLAINTFKEKYDNDFEGNIDARVVEVS